MQESRALRDRRSGILLVYAATHQQTCRLHASASALGPKKNVGKNPVGAKGDKKFGHVVAGAGFNAVRTSFRAFASRILITPRAEIVATDAKKDNNLERNDVKTFGLGTLPVPVYW
jgi:hypothetical protein